MTIYRTYLTDYIFENETIEGLMAEVAEEAPGLGGFDVYEVKNYGTEQEEEVFYALIKMY